MGYDRVNRNSGLPKDSTYQKQLPYNLRVCSAECFLTVANAGPVALVWYDFFSFVVLSLDDAIFAEEYVLKGANGLTLNLMGMRCNEIDRADV
jgi:hypothetical protein